MSEINFGDHINRMIVYSKSLLFEQGELAQLTFIALTKVSNGLMDQGEDEEIEIDVPIGYSPYKQPMMSKKKFKNKELVNKFNFLAHNQLAINGIYQLVMVVETMLNDLLFEIILKYPQKIGNKRKIEVEHILKAVDINQIHFEIIYTIINELTYKSPKDYADGFNNYTSINLLECPSFHKFIEIKATRDVLIHNRGIANSIYTAKAGMHPRVKEGIKMPVNDVYFMESYEYCLQLSEWLEKEMHEKWHSEDFIRRNKKP